jgi:Tfp pilus assembly protein PilF
MRAAAAAALVLTLAACAGGSSGEPVQDRRRCQAADEGVSRAQDEFQLGHFAEGMSLLRAVREAVLVDAAEWCATPTSEEVMVRP